MDWAIILASNRCYKAHGSESKIGTMKSPGETRRIRVVSWNIEKGKRWPELIACLESNDLAAADIFCLNEVDEGMARSGNRLIAQELADLLKMHVVFGPAYKELTKGTGEERFVSGENLIGRQGAMRSFRAFRSLRRETSDCRTATIQRRVTKNA
jgi:endonuclease/exonuclease/phosphatase family metal-dependent hydrolase